MEINYIKKLLFCRII